MPSRQFLAAVAAVVALPLLFAVLGGSRTAGLAIGAVLVAGGLAAALLGGRSGDGDRS